MVSDLLLPFFSEERSYAPKDHQQHFEQIQYLMEL